MDAKRTADKYVERGGYLPGDRQGERLPHDMVTVASYLAWHHPDHIMGGVSAGEAYIAFCRLANLDPVGLRKIVTK